MSIRGFMIGLALVAIAPPAWATSFTFLLDPIVGEDPAFIPEVTATFDTGNAYLVGEDPYQWLVRVRDRLVHLHAKDISIQQSDV